MGVKVEHFHDLTPLRGYKENFFAIKDFRKFKKDEHNHGMYFLKIYRFWGVNHLLYLVEMDSNITLHSILSRLIPILV